MRVLLIDDHALFREGIALLLRARFPQVLLYQAADLAEAALVLDSVEDISCILLDLGLRESRGIESLHAFYRLAGPVRVVVLSADDRPETVQAVMAAGADGFIPKTARGGRIEQHLRSVFEGRRFELAPPHPAAAVPIVDVSHACQTALDLSLRQLEVLCLLAEGKSNKQIGRELALAESTVKSHVVLIFRKLGVASRTEATLLAARMGLTSPVKLRA
jgi:DNA-binding NarL/FixJ family response regulator